MLVLSRKPGERLVIDGNIVITIVELLPGRVKVGIEAPRNVTVYREEIWAAMQQPKEEEDNAG
jgi:carbon storage regulator